MRKRISSLLLVTLISFPTLAQNIQGSYKPMADGEIRKQQVEYTVSEAMGENIVWDFSSMEQPDEDYTVKYTLAETGGNDSIIVGKEQQTRYYYRSDVDSVMLCGYETNLTKVQYDRPELLLKMPLTYGSRHDGLFHGTMSYCEKMFMRICGSYQVEVDGTGSMLLPNGDTLRHVSRVHIRTLTAKRHYPDISTEHELKTYTDSIEPYTDSNIRQVLMTDTLLTETNIYRWYAAGYRYPVMETSETISPETDQRQPTAYYCAPEEQTLMDDDENAEIRRLLAAYDSQHAGNNNGSDDNSDSSYKTLDARNVHVNVNGHTIAVSYELVKDATVTALVCDVSGILYQQASHNGAAGENCEMTVCCDGLRSGQYVLYLNVNGQVTSYTVHL